MLTSRLVLARASSATRRASLVRPRSLLSSDASSIIATVPSHHRCFQSLASSSPSSLSLLSFPSPLHSYEFPLSRQNQQVRWKGRKSGSSALDPKPRRWSKKQKQRFKRKIEKEKDLTKHSPPGFKAGKRREYIAKEHEAMAQEYQERLDGTYHMKKLAASNPLEDMEYTKDDALLDAVVGNAGGHWTSQPTIEPVYTGNRQKAFYNRVVDQMELYHEAVQALPSSSSSLDTTTTSLLHLFPSDKDVGAALRAYRDRHGTRNKPIGLAKALQHVLKELGIPSTTAFGEYTYNALLSCCRTPKEGLRVFQLMHQNQHDISAYSWSILVDIHSKVGDFEGCVRVMDEMIMATAEGGQHQHQPNITPNTLLPAYTSLLAACYKVCNNGRIAHSVRSRAGEVAWEKWQELRIAGVEPDVMCYGAILRLCAARGQPEKALNLLEEMPRFEVQPTTLCFSSALKAVAKSHETAVRYERGWSKKNKRRERVTAHHAKMTRNIVLLAEAAGVEQDDGFISALQLCAAAAGDSATAKAVYLASEVRRNMKHLRQVGSDEHLQRLLGEGEDHLDSRLQAGPHPLSLVDGSTNGSGANNNSLTTRHQSHTHRQPMSYGEREYGKDTRTLSAILKACASASDTSMVGEMWSGRENYGYLDLTSLRLIQERRKPLYRNTDIPGMNRTEAGVARLVSLEDLENPRKRNDPDRRKDTRQKFKGVVTLDDDGTNLDDLSDDMYDVFHDKKTGMLKQEYIDSGDYPEYEAYQRGEAYRKAEARTRELAASDPMVQIEAGSGDVNFAAVSTSTSDESNVKEKEEVEWYFDYDNRRWGTRPKQTTLEAVGNGDDTPRYNDDPVHAVDAEAPEEEEFEEEWYFDDDARRWKTRMKPRQNQVNAVAAAGQEEQPEPILTEFEAQALERMQNNADLGDLEFAPEDEAEFTLFFNQLKEEVAESGEDMEVDEEEVRNLFMMMKNEFSEEQIEELMENAEHMENSESVVSSEKTAEAPEVNEALPTLARGRSGAAKTDFQDIVEDLKEEWSEDTFDEDMMDPDNPDHPARVADAAFDDKFEDGDDVPSHQFNTTENIMSAFPEKGDQTFGGMVDPRQASTMLREREDNPEAGLELMEQQNESFLQGHKGDSLPQALEEDAELQELKELLPGMPMNRLKKIRQAYQESLSDPSMLTLVPLLRENMPDVLTSFSLKARNLRTAEFVFQKAEKEGLVDGHILNGVLQVHTASGRLDKAMETYEQFEKYKQRPTSYSDRLVVQMFIKNRRFSKALMFKQKLEDRGRQLDLLAYGPIIDYCSRHGQVGSALMMLKECVAVNGSPPGEHYLKELRNLCRQYELEEVVGLEGMIGEDPLEWLRRGEAVLKREKSYRGNRDLNLLRNAGVRA